MVAFQAIVDKCLNDARTRSGNPLAMRGFSTGIIPLDNITNGLPKYEMTLIAGRSGVGKSTLSFGMAFDVARSGSEVLLVSLEMNADMVVAKELCRQSGVAFDKYLSGMRPAELEAFEEHHARLRDLPILLRNSLHSVAEIEQVVEHEGPDLVVVDYIQLLKAPSNDARHLSLSNIVYGLHDIVLNKGIGVLAISQMNRNIESSQRKSKTPLLSDLAESDALGRAPENVWILTNATDEAEEDGRLVDIHIVKSRYGRAGTAARVWFDGSHSKFKGVQDV